MTEKPSRNEEEYFARQDAELIRRERSQLEATRTAAERRTHFMKCPKGGYDLASQDYQGVVIEVCSHCGGMWLDAGELQSLAHHHDRHGMLARVFGDVLDSLRPAGKGPSGAK